jgi:hypothetical protein
VNFSNNITHHWSESEKIAQRHRVRHEWMLGSNFLLATYTNGAGPIRSTSRDVLAFLIAAAVFRRWLASAELSDVVAHREKDRGPLKTYVHHVLTYGEAVVAKRDCASANRCRSLGHCVS